MVCYLIEFRFQSVRIKKYLKSTIYEINRKFKVGKIINVPHITLVGPIKTSNEKRLISDFARICSGTRLMKLKMLGFGTFDSNRVVYVNIGASDRFNEFRVNLAKTLKPYCTLQSHDKREDKDRFSYHSTLAMNLSPEKFNAIKNYIDRKPKPDYNQIVMRVTLLKGGKILREYDFMQRRLFNRRQALNRHILRNSKELLRKFIDGRYDPDRKLRPVDIIPQKTWWERIKSFFGM